MPTMTNFGGETIDLAKGKELADRLTKVQKMRAEDPDFLNRIMEDPSSALRPLGFGDLGVKKFRVLDNVTTLDSCACSCFPIACGTGLGCFIAGGNGDTSHSC